MPVSTERLLEGLPHNTEAEKNALVRMIAHEDYELSTILQSEDFYDNTYRMIFEAAKTVIDNTGAVDFVLICEALQNSKKIQDIGGSVFLAELMQSQASPAKSSVSVMKRCRAARESLSMGATLEAVVREGRVGEVPMLLAQNADRLSGLLPKETKMNREDMIAELTTTNKTIPTGFPTMDLLLGGGLGPGDLFLIAARPSVGKSSLATTLTANFLKQGVRPAVFSLEMSRKQIVTRILCSYYNQSPDYVRANAKDCINGVETDMTLFIGVDDLGSIQMETMATEADVIIIDYFGLITMHSKENRFQQMDEISRAIKNLAVHTETPVIMLTQLNREIEKAKENREPNLSDLFGGGEKDADLITMLWDPSAKGKTDGDATDVAADLEGRTDCDLKWIVRKNRNGPTGYVNLRFDKPKFHLYEEIPNAPLARKEAFPF